MSLTYTYVHAPEENVIDQITRPIRRLFGWLTEPRVETQMATETITVTQQQMLLKTVNEGITLCSTKILTLVDVDKINEVLSYRSSLYLTNYRQAGNAFKDFVSGHGYIKTGGFNFEFQRTNSFRITIDGRTIEMSDAALFMLLAFIFGIIVFSAIFPGASILAVQAGASTYAIVCSIQ
jgi:hypothetical protein